MLKSQIWGCDECGEEESCNGFPKGWMTIRIEKMGGYKIGDLGGDMIKDCCSQACVNKVVLDYYSVHRLEE